MIYLHCLNLVTSFVSPVQDTEVQDKVPWRVTKMIRELEHITYNRELREEGLFGLERRRKPKEMFYCCLL